MIIHRLSNHLYIKNYPVNKDDYVICYVKSRNIFYAWHSDKLNTVGEPCYSLLSAIRYVTTG